MDLKIQVNAAKVGAVFLFASVSIEILASVLPDVEAKIAIPGAALGLVHNGFPGLAVENNVSRDRADLEYGDVGFSLLEGKEVRRLSFFKTVLGLAIADGFGPISMIGYFQFGTVLGQSRDDIGVGSRNSRCS